MATSNRDLAAGGQDGTFREDLLYRLNVVNLRLPPLRERPGDILALADHFVQKYAAANGMPERPLSMLGAPALLTHRWPGNVRELENAMHRAVLLSSGPRDRRVRHPPAGRRADAELARRGDRPCGVDSGRGRHPRLRRPDSSGGRAAADHRHAQPLPRQPNPRGQHPRHLDPHPAQQAEGILRRRRSPCRRRSRARRTPPEPDAHRRPDAPDRRRRREPRLGAGGCAEPLGRDRGARSADGWASRRWTWPAAGAWAGAPTSDSRCAAPSRRWPPPRC